MRSKDEASHAVIRLAQRPLPALAVQSDEQKAKPALREAGIDIYTPVENLVTVAAVIGS